MKRNIILLCVVLFAGVLGGLAWIGLHSREPAYQGKPLSAWMDQWDHYLLASRNTLDLGKREEAKAAIQHIGTNALPVLLKLAGAKDSALKRNFIAVASRQHLLKLKLPPAEYYHARATCGFSALGPAAKPAVPALVAMLSDQDREVRASAAQCLSLIGPEAAEAVPALIQTLNREGNGYGPVLINSMLALGAIHAEPEQVLPVLLEYLSGPRASWNYSVPAMQALGRYRAQAKTAVPAILPFLKDPDPSHQSAADAALCAIDPHAAAQAIRQ